MWKKLVGERVTWARDYATVDEAQVIETHDYDDIYCHYTKAYPTYSLFKVCIGTFCTA